MGVTRTQEKTQVVFDYLIAETYVSVVANIYAGNSAQIIDGKPTESSTDPYCEIVAASYFWNGKATAWDEILPFIAADIEREAWEVYRKG